MSGADACPTCSRSPASARPSCSSSGDVSPRRSSPTPTSTASSRSGRDQRVPARRSRGDPAQRRDARSCPTPDAAARRAPRDQGPALDQGHADHLCVAHPRGLPPRLRRDGRRARPRRRAGQPRQGQHGRVRDGLVQRDLGLRPRAQPVGSHEGARRQLGRQRRGRGWRLRPVGARLRHGWLDPPAGRPVRHRRHEADLRRRLALRSRRLRVEPRPDRPDDEQRRRLRRVARGDRRARPARHARRVGPARADRARAARAPRRRAPGPAAGSSWPRASIPT